MAKDELNPYAPPDADEPIPSSLDFAQGIPAERGTRLGAAMIDGLVYTAAALPGLVMMAGADRQDPWPAIVVFSVLLCIAVGYQWYLITTVGQSIGKRALRIRIVRLDGTLPGFVNGVILRAWIIGALQAVPYVGGFINLVDILMIFGEDRRCLHDRIAGTIVVQV